jgi:hypothetical protein
VFVVDPRAGIESVQRLVAGMVQAEVRTEGAKCDTAAWTHGVSHTFENNRVAFLTVQQTKAALTERDGGIELAGEVEQSGVTPIESGPGWRGLRGEVDEALRYIDANDFETATGEGMCVTAGSAADVEDAITVVEGKGVEQKIDFLLRAFRERVPEIRRPQVRSYRFEPMWFGRGH